METSKAALTKEQTQGDDFASYLGFSDYGATYRSGGKDFVMTCDGVGTKIYLAKMLDKYDTIGIDLVAMCENDLLCMGASAEVFMDYYATEEFDWDKSKQIIKGIKEGCDLAGCKLVGGETAQMRSMFGHQTSFDVAGWAMGEKLFNQRTHYIDERTYLVGLPSSGVHSNGFGHIRKNSWSCWNNFSKQLFIPTKIYTNEILSIKNHMWACAHITGGGLYGNIPRILEGRKFELTLPPPNEYWKEFFSYMKRTVPEHMLPRIFNCGWGMVVATNEPDAIEVEGAKIIGRVL